MTDTEPDIDAARIRALSAGLNPFRPRISHVSYYVRDADRALDFYVGVLGMEEQMRVDVEHGEQEIVLGFPESKGAGLILMVAPQRDSAYQLGDGYSRLLIRVGDVDAAVAHLVRHGAALEAPVQEAELVRFALIRDPEGYLIELMQVKR